MLAANGTLTAIRGKKRSVLPRMPAEVVYLMLRMTLVVYLLPRMTSLGSISIAEDDLGTDESTLPTMTNEFSA